MDFDLRSLQHLRAVAEHRSFTRAARALHITQPALTRSVQLLEHRVGAKLFVRGRSGTDLTDAGRIFLEHATDLLARAEDLGRQVAFLHGLGGRVLEVGAGPYPVRLLMGRTVARLAGAEAGFRLRLVGGQYPELITALRRRELDLVVAESSAVEGDREFEIHPLRTYQGYAVARAGHPLSARGALTVAEALAYPLALSGRIPPRVLEPLIGSLPRARRATSAGAFPAIECGDIDTLAAVAAGSDAITLTPLSLVERHLADGTLVVLPLELPWAVTRFAIIRLRGRRLPDAAESFTRELLAADEVVHAADERLRAAWGAPGEGAGAGVPSAPAGQARGASSSSARTSSGAVNIASRPASSRGHSASGRSR